MENIQKPEQCQHSGCNCPRPQTGDYCSDYCMNAPKDEMNAHCQCGHPQCSK